MWRARSVLTLTRFYSPGKSFQKEERKNRRVFKEEKSIDFQHWFCICCLDLFSLHSFFFCTVLIQSLTSIVVCISYVNSNIYSCEIPKRDLHTKIHQQRQNRKKKNQINKRTKGKAKNGIAKKHSIFLFFKLNTRETLILSHNKHSLKSMYFHIV